MKSGLSRKQSWHTVIIKASYVWRRIRYIMIGQSTLLLCIIRFEIGLLQVRSPFRRFTQLRMQLICSSSQSLWRSSGIAWTSSITPLVRDWWEGFPTQYRCYKHGTTILQTEIFHQGGDCWIWLKRSIGPWWVVYLGPKSIRASLVYILSRVILCKQQRESKQGKQESIVRGDAVRATLRPWGENRLSVRGTESL